MHPLELLARARETGLWREGCTSPSRRGKTPKEKKFMSEFQEPISHTSTGTPRWVGLAVAVLGGVSLLGLGVGWSALNHANSIEQSTQASVKQANDALAQRLAKEDDVNQA